jgi:hypothetical protein
MKEFCRGIVNYAEYHPFNKNMFAVHGRAIKSNKDYKVVMEITQKLPARLMKAAADIPFIGT